MQLAILSTQFAPRVGGAEAQAQTFASALHKRGHTVHVFTLRFDQRWPRHEVIEGINVTRIGGLTLRKKLRLGYGAQWVNYLATAFALWHARHRYEVIHVTTFSAWSGVATFIGWLARKRVIVSCASTGPEAHDPVLRESIAWLYPGTPQPDHPWAAIPARYYRGRNAAYLQRDGISGWIAYQVMRVCPVTIIALSSRMYTMLGNVGFPLSRIVMLPNIVEIPLQIRDRQEPSTQPIVLCVARLSYEKGLDVLLFAWQIVHRVIPEARLCIAGDGPLRYALHQCVTHLDLSDSVEFLGLRQDISALLTQADAFVLPSRWEGLSNALLEAMAHGLPCVATRVSGSEDVVNDGVSGRLVPPLDPHSMAEVLLDLLCHPALAQQLGVVARQTAIEIASPDVVLARYLALCERGSNQRGPVS